MRWVGGIAIGLFLAGSAFAQELERDVTELHQPLTNVLTHEAREPGKIAVVGGLTADEVGRIVRRHWIELKNCYERFGYGPAGEVEDAQVELAFAIGSVGDVVTTSIVSEPRISDFERCLRANVERWKFPAPRGGGVVEVLFPFTFLAVTNLFPSAPLLAPAVRRDLFECFSDADRVVFGIRLDEAGGLLQFRVVEPAAMPERFVRCYEKSVKRWVFPTDFPRDGTEVEIPVALHGPSPAKVSFPVAEPFLRGELAACHDAAADELDGFAPDLTVSVHIDKNGDVDAARVLQSSSPFPAFEQCLLDAVRHWHANDDSLRGGQMLFRLNFWPR